MNTLVVLALFAVAALGAGDEPVPELLKESKIINGHSIRIQEFPHQCSLRQYGYHVCGCAFIGKRWALTAAHCVGAVPFFHTVMFGSSRLYYSGVVYTVKSFTSHPDYSYNSGMGFPNDIAIIEFYSNVKETSAIQRIAMDHPAGSDFGGRNCHISGWGHTTTGSGGSMSNILQFVTINVLTPRQCSQRFTNTNREKHVCVGGRGNGGGCTGDSGGPLTCYNRNGRVLAGLASFAAEGCSTYYPTVYTRVSNYKSWVEKYTGSL